MNDTGEQGSGSVSPHLEGSRVEEVTGQDGDGHEDKDEGEGEEAQEAQAMDKPVRPSQQEVDRHNLTHLPYRTWCAHCVKGKAVGSPHRNVKREGEKSVPTVVTDYMYLNAQEENKDGEDIKDMPVLTMKDSELGVVRADMVPGKGVNAYAVSRAKSHIQRLGHKTMVYKSDNEPAMVALKGAVKNEVTEDLVMEESPVEDSQANGIIERTNRTVQGQFRTMKSQLEERYKQVVSVSHMCIPWLISHAAMVITLFHVGQDGQTGYQRWKGKAFNKRIPEFGESVWFMPIGQRAKKGNRNKFKVK